MSEVVHESISGTVKQLLRPEKVRDFQVGREAELFSRWGYSVAVLIDKTQSRSLKDRIKQLHPHSKPKNVYHILTLNPGFSEGDKIQIEGERLYPESNWIVVPSHPITESDDSPRKIEKTQPVCPQCDEKADARISGDSYQVVQNRDTQASICYHRETDTIWFHTA